MSGVFALNLRSIAKRERDIGHSELAAIIEQAADEIERQREYRATHPYSELDMDMHVEAVTKDLRTRLAEAAAFLDGMAKRLDNPLAKSLPQAAADCRAMAAKLRGKD